jgi:putative endonuclease
MYYVYILSNKSKTVLYTGVTNNLARRIEEHYHQKTNNKTLWGRYLCHYLLYYEEYMNISDAIMREKRNQSMEKIEKVKLNKVE